MTPQPHSRPQGQGNATRGQASETSRIEVSDIRFGEKIAATLYADIARDKAEFIAEHSGREVNKGTQLRRFYDELTLWNEKINGSGTEAERARRYEELAPLVKMLVAKVAYAKGRKHVDENFETLFRHVIDAVKDAKTLEQSKLFMEAFMGFYKATHKG